jgi:hypothetical protein
MRRALKAIAGARTLGTSSSLEAMEPRLVLSAPVVTTPLPAWVNASQMVIPIVYQSDVPLDLSTLDGRDIAVTGPNGFAQWATFDYTGQVNGAVAAYYHVTAPGGQWNPASANGTYNVGIAQDAVRNTSGEGNAAGGAGSYWFWFGAQAALSGADVLTGRGPEAGSTVFFGTYQSSFDAWDLHFNYYTGYLTYAPTLVVHVTGPNGFSQTTVAAERVPYRTLPRENYVNLVSASVLAPGGTWDFGDNGDYTVQLGYLAAGSSYQDPRMGEVLLTQIGTVQGISTPRAEVVSSAFGTRDWLFSVRYTAAPGATINVGSVTDLNVQGYFAMTPLHNLAATLLQPPVTNSDGSVAAVYRVQSPMLDGWASTYSGVGQVWTRSGGVTDTANRSVGVGPIVTQTPSHDRPSVLNLLTTSAVVNGWNLELTMLGAGALAGTLTPGGGNLSVYADINGVYQLAPLNVQFVSSSTEANDILAVRYRIVPRQGYFWDGTFTVQMNPQNMFSVDWGVGFSQAFVMHFAGPSVQGLRTLARTNTSWDVELAFNNPGSLISTSSLSSQNLIVAAPGGRTMHISLVSFANSDGVLRVRYRITPVNAGTALPHGTYGFSLRGGSVMTAGVALPGQFLAGFTI